MRRFLLFGVGLLFAACAMLAPAQAGISGHGVLERRGCIDELQRSAGPSNPCVEMDIIKVFEVGEKLGVAGYCKSEAGIKAVEDLAKVGDQQGYVDLIADPKSDCFDFRMVGLPPLTGTYQRTLGFFKGTNGRCLETVVMKIGDKDAEEVFSVAVADDQRRCGETT